MQKFRDVMGRWERRELSGLEAAELLGCSERQFRRYRRRHEDEGMEGLADRRLGKVSAKRVPVDRVMWMLDLYRSEYRGWNVKHFHEQLQAAHGFRWGYTWTKPQLHAAGLVVRAARRGAHRRKRERKPCEGMMLHQDGSRAAWLAGEAALDLIVTMDDATSTIYSAFLVEEEGTASTFRGLLEVFVAHGLPSSLYTDRGSHYFHTARAGEAVDRQHLTQVGRALDRLGIEHIAAYSPQARGRSERMFATLQDRLIKELAKAGLREIGAANEWLRQVYLPQHNARFARPAALAESGFVRVGEVASLAETLCIQEERVVDRANTVSWGRLRLQLPASPLRAHYVKARVRVHQYPDASLAVFHGPRCIARYGADGEPSALSPTCQSMTACSPPSRTLRAACGGGLRPSLTAAARAVTPQRQVGTEKRPAGRTKKHGGRASSSASPATL